MNPLQQKLNELLTIVSTEADKSEETFFKNIEASLNSLCEAIAQETGADSAAVFFATDDNPPGSQPYMVMRGASGCLWNTFSNKVEGWRDWRQSGKKSKVGYSGFAYPSEITDEFCALNAEERLQAIKGWSVTNQVWHLAKGRLANSNRAMDELHGGVARTGRGDPDAYRGSELYTTFRTMVAVPIFAQGKADQVITVQENQEDDRYPETASSSSEFLGRYRVIGILKVENKQPECERIAYGDIKSALEQYLTNNFDLSPVERRKILAWCKKSASDMKRAFSLEGYLYPELMRDETKDGTDSDRKRRLRKEVADALISCSQTEFTRQDTELLVLLAMQVGRLITRRIVTYAADCGIVIGENEVGLLNIHWRDIDQLAALGRAADAATLKLGYHLEALKSELDYERRQMIFRLRVSELLDAQGPIREVTTRRKEYISLIRKLIRKQRFMDDNPTLRTVAFTDFNLGLKGYGIRSGERATATGPMRFEMDRPRVGEAVSETTARLGVKGGVQATVDGHPVVALHSEKRACYDELPLVKRILAPGCYAIDDLAGARVITDYTSDIAEVIDELRTRMRLWNVELCKVDDLPNGKDGGYRATHLTVQLEVSSLLSSEDAATLRHALGIEGDKPIFLPAEIQLRTAYQHSWALKTHGSSYKREEQIPEDLTDEQEILSNVLAQADSLSDIVRVNIESSLLPYDHGERHLVAFLARHCSLAEADLNTVKFGLACAKEILKDQLRYNGQPEYGFAIEVCERLVYNFGFFDSTMLVLALLRNVWRPERGKRSQLTVSGDPNPETYNWENSTLSLLCEQLELKCGSVLAKYHDLLLLSPDLRQQSHWLQSWMAGFPSWFWIMQRAFHEYFTKPPENRTEQVKKRLKDMYEWLKNAHQEGQGSGSLDEWLERAFVIEAAVLMAILTELPHEPSRAHRKHHHDDYLSLYREIRKYLPNGPTKTRVVEELERAFREVETQLDLTREPEWWSE
jgi:ppGpp synthetase/RelA/SpoT-type nucleotidyltranferase